MSLSFCLSRLYKWCAHWSLCLSRIYRWYAYHSVSVEFTNGARIGLSVSVEFTDDVLNHSVSVEFTNDAWISLSVSVDFTDDMPIILSVSVEFTNGARIGLSQYSLQTMYAVSCWKRNVPVINGTSGNPSNRSMSLDTEKLESIIGETWNSFISYLHILSPSFQQFLWFPRIFLFPSIRLIFRLWSTSPVACWLTAQLQTFSLMFVRSRRPSYGVQ